MNVPHTPRECLGYVFRKVDYLMLHGVTEVVALKLAAEEYGITFRKLLVLWLDRGRPE